MCFELHDGTAGFFICLFLLIFFLIGKTPVRIFFHVDYKPVASDGKDMSRVVSKDDVPTLQNDILAIERKIKEISSEIEHAKRQETYLNKANGEYFEIKS
jgi:hypothetical protein